MFTPQERQLFATAFPNRESLQFQDLIDPQRDDKTTEAPMTYDSTRLQVARAEWRRIFAQKTMPQSHPPMAAPIRLSTENLRQNIPWGDVLAPKDPTHTRFYGMNANGIQLDREGGQFTEYCKLHVETQADISGIQEHNLDTTQPRLRSIMYDTVRKHWKRSTFSHASTPITFASPYKPGGTLLLSTDSITGRVVDHGSDIWGRWAYQSLQGRQGIKVTFISAYQVVETHESQMGNITAAAQQRSLLATSNDPVSNPRQAFIRDLTIFITTLQRQQHDIVLTGDFNERLGEDDSGMAQVMSRCQLLDVMATLHPHLPEPATYARGRKRLDYILVSHRLIGAARHAGYEPFSHRFHTDHRAYFLDFDTVLLFGGATQKLATYVQRQLQASNINQTTQYLREKHAQLTAKDAFKRSERLLMPGNRHRFAERLDRDLVNISLAAEKHTARYAQPMWSVKLDKARKKVSVLKRILTMYRTQMDLSSQLQPLIQQMQESFLYPSNAQECSQYLRKAQAEVKSIIKEHYQTREEEQKEKIASLAASASIDDQHKAKILRNIRVSEAIKRVYDKIRAFRNTNTPKGITQVEIPCDEADDPKTCSHWRTIDIPTEVLHHLQTRNRRHFGQAHGTPFTIAPYAQQFGFKGDTSQADAVYNGTYDWTSVEDPEVKLLLQYMQRAQHTFDDPILTDITIEAFQSKLRTWRESTSTSPSGLHLGHYKAMVSRHKYSEADPTDPARIELDNIQQDLLTLHLRLVNYALRTGYSYSRWNQVVNTMLWKEPGNYKIHRTRVIHIYEADYNLVLSLKWREALLASEKSGVLNEGQYGSRPG